LEDWKIKVSVLWIFAELTGLASSILMLLEQRVLKEILDWGTVKGMEMKPEYLLVGAIFMLVPLVMAFLSLTLKDSTNRWANIIVGIVWLGLGLTALPTYVAEPAYATLMWLAGGVALALIVWYAWTSKQKA